MVPERFAVSDLSQLYRSVSKLGSLLGYPGCCATSWGTMKDPNLENYPHWLGSGLRV